jgi:hypothetical protein
MTIAVFLEGLRKEESISLLETVIQVRNDPDDTRQIYLSDYLRVTKLLDCGILEYDDDSVLRLSPKGEE